MKPRILYVSAWGRSGTTLVDNILDAYPTVFSAGELRYLWRRGLMQRQDCGCGQPVAQCPFWEKILIAAYGSKVPDPDHVVCLQKSLRTRSAVSLARGSWPSAATQYAKIMTGLYKGIHEVTGADLIVDSSKLPAEAAILARTGEVDTYLLHMVRDARAVAHSWSRPTPHPDRPALMMMQHGPVKSTLNWCTWNLLTELMAPAYQPRFRRVRYEDLVADPQGQIESIMRFAGAAPADGPFEARDRVRLSTNHTVSGNPRRFTVGEVQIRPDEAWRIHQGTRQRLIATAIGLPLLIRYRYPLWPSRCTTPVVEPRGEGH